MSYTESDEGQLFQSGREQTSEILSADAVYGDGATRDAVVQRMKGCHSLIHIMAHGVDVGKTYFSL